MVCVPAVRTVAKLTAGAGAEIATVCAPAARLTAPAAIPAVLAESATVCRPAATVAVPAARAAVGALMATVAVWVGMRSVSRAVGAERATVCVPAARVTAPPPLPAPRVGAVTAIVVAPADRVRVAVLTAVGALSAIVCPPAARVTAPATRSAVGAETARVCVPALSVVIGVSGVVLGAGGPQCQIPRRDPCRWNRTGIETPSALGMLAVGAEIARVCAPAWTVTPPAVAWTAGAVTATARTPAARVTVAVRCAVGAETATACDHRHGRRDERHDKRARRQDLRAGIGHERTEPVAAEPALADWSSEREERLLCHA
jgi:hypothetical protein